MWNVDLLMIYHIIEAIEHILKKDKLNLEILNCQSPLHMAEMHRHHL